METTEKLDTLLDWVTFADEEIEHPCQHSRHTGAVPVALWAVHWSCGCIIEVCQPCCDAARDQEKRRVRGFIRICCTPHKTQGLRLLRITPLKG